MNGKVIQFIAFRRSGSHAVINWIACQFEDAGYSVVRFNDVKKNRRWVPNDNMLLFPNFEDNPLPIGSDYAEGWDVILLRDPFNMLASRFKQPTWVSAISPQFYMSYVDEYLGYTNHLRNRVSINYNEWLVDAEYRRKVIGWFDIPFTDRGFNQMLDPGKSSFYDRTPVPEKLLSRWKEFANNPEYRGWFTEDVLQASQRIFKMNPFRKPKMFI